MKKEDIKVLVACEESQAVTIEFRKLGIEAFSCDLLPCSGGHPEWHLHCDVFEIINNGWTLMVAHPECTRLTVTANKWYKPEFSHRFPTIHEDREKAVEFFMAMVNAPIKYKAIENPIGIMSTRYRKPDQIIQPYQFGSPTRKATCLWLSGLPKLVHTDIVAHEVVTFKSGKTMSKEHYLSASMKKEERRKKRSVTFPGIAKALADQYSRFILSGLSVQEWANINR
jgi:hypothetical protein